MVAFVVSDLGDIQLNDSGFGYIVNLYLDSLGKSNTAVT